MALHAGRVCEAWASSWAGALQGFGQEARSLCRRHTFLQLSLPQRRFQFAAHSFIQRQDMDPDLHISKIEKYYKEVQQLRGSSGCRLLAHKRHTRSRGLEYAADYLLEHVRIESCSDLQTRIASWWSSCGPWSGMRCWMDWTYYRRKMRDLQDGFRRTSCPTLESVTQRACSWGCAKKAA